MAYEIFTRKVVRAGSPAISINPLGRISLNQKATVILQINGVEDVLALWDDSESKIALRKSSKSDARAYHVSFGLKGGGAAFSAKTFFDHVKYDYSATRTFTATWNPEEQMLEIDLRQSDKQVTQLPQRKGGRPQK